MIATRVDKTVTAIEIGTSAQPQDAGPDQGRGVAGSLGPDPATETGNGLEGRGQGTARGRGRGRATEIASVDEADPRVNETETANAAVAKTEAGVSQTRSRTSL